MREYKEINHMTELNENETSSNLIYYLPHHPIICESSLTTKLRVVFDGSYKTDNGVSLNDIQYIGNVVQQDIFSILIRFRKHAFAITSDLEKMYRQILLHKSHRNLQRILWREDSSKPIKMYTLNTVTYGTSSAPFIAPRCIIQLGLDIKITNPTLSKITEEDFYMDDLLTGDDSIEKAIQLYKDITVALNSAKFSLHKWSSNSKELLKIISNDNVLSDSTVKVCENQQNKT